RSSEFQKENFPPSSKRKQLDTMEGHWNTATDTDDGDTSTSSEGYKTHLHQQEMNDRRTRLGHYPNRSMNRSRNGQSTTRLCYGTPVTHAVRSTSYKRQVSFLHKINQIKALDTKSSVERNVGRTRGSLHAEDLF